MRQTDKDIFFVKLDEIEVDLSEDEVIAIHAIDDEEIYNDDLPEPNPIFSISDSEDTTDVQNTNSENAISANTVQLAETQDVGVNTIQEAESQDVGVTTVQNAENQDVRINSAENAENKNVGTSTVQNTQIRRSNSEEGYIMDDTAFVSINYLGIDPATGLIEVFVHINKMENFILHRTDTIGTLKQMIFERKGIPVDIQKLVFTGRILKDDTTLTENRIQCGSSIHMFIRIRGGVMNCNDQNEEAHASDTNTTNYI